MSLIDDNTLTYRIALSMAPGMNITTGRHMLEAVGDVTEFFKMDEREFINRFHVSTKIANDDYRLGLLERARQEVQFISRKSIIPLWMEDDEYPTRLKVCDDAPMILYTYGNANLDSRYMVAIVGTRNATAYGTEMVARLVRDLAQEYGRDVVIVSGLAYGIDIAAHKAALKCDIPTIAVTAHPLNTVYPAEHRSTAASIINAGGALVTEYTTSQSIHKGNFIARNRIIAALCDATIVVESDTKGGAMITARIASEYNREVFAVPGRINDRYSRGTNHLIATNRAALITNAEDLIQAMNWPKRPKQPKQQTLNLQLSPEQSRVYNYIKDHPDCMTNEIIIRLAISYSELSSILFQLEMADIIKTLPGNRYMIIQTDY